MLAERILSASICRPVTGSILKPARREGSLDKGSLHQLGEALSIPLTTGRGQTGLQNPAPRA